MRGKRRHEKGLPSRRQALRIAGGFGALTLIGCNVSNLGGQDASGGVDAAGAGADAAGESDLAPPSCAPAPAETAGPCPDKVGMLDDGGVAL